MSEVIIRQANFEKDILPLVGKAKKAGVSMHNASNTHWFCAEKDGVVFACSCVMINEKAKSARWKSSYTLEEYRGLGAYKRMLQIRLAFAKKMGVKDITVYVRKRHLPVMLGLGFQIVTVSAQSHKGEKRDLFFLRKKLE